MKSEHTILLRRPRPEDKALVVSLRRKSRKFLEPWEATPPDGSSPFSTDWFDRFLASSQTESSHRFLIMRVQGSHPPRRRPGRGASAIQSASPIPEIVGQISLGGIIRGAFHSCYVGYWIGEPFARQGIMRRALRLALEHAFESLRLHRVEANIIPENVPSKNLVQSMGFEYEGLAKRYLRINHAWRDHEHWAITREVWDDVRNAATTDHPPITPARPKTRRPSL